MSFSLGGLSFDDIKGDLVIPGMMRDIEAKTGDDGVAVFNIGSRGEPFELETRYAFASWALARAAEMTYAATFTAAPVNCILGGYNYTATGFQFVLLGPPKTRIESIAAWQGLRSGSPVTVSPAFVVYAVWRIVAVAV